MTQFGFKSEIPTTLSLTCRLEPLLARVKEDRKLLVTPAIDLIDLNTLAFEGSGSGSVGGFWWSLHFTWWPIPRRERLRRNAETDPLR